MPRHIHHKIPPANTKGTIILINFFNLCTKNYELRTLNFKLFLIFALQKYNKK